MVDKFSNVKKLTLDEKKSFILDQKLKDKPRLFFAIISIFLWAYFILMTLTFISDIILFISGEYSKMINIGNLIICIISLLISFILGKKSNKAIMKNKRLVKRILNEDMYVVECKIYDKKYKKTQDTAGTVYNNYYVKITDGNYIVNQWVEISKEKYEQNNNDIRVYIFDKTDSEYFLVF